jgi:hypothetical protein
MRVVGLEIDEKRHVKLTPACSAAQTRGKSTKGADFSNLSLKSPVKNFKKTSFSSHPGVDEFVSPYQIFSVFFARIGGVILRSVVRLSPVGRGQARRRHTLGEPGENDGRIFLLPGQLFRRIFAVFGSNFSGFGVLFVQIFEEMLSRKSPFCILHRREYRARN